MDRAELIESMQTGRAAWENALDRIGSEDRFLETSLHGGWSVKDVIAHVAFWEERALEIYQALANGQNPPPNPGGNDLDATNTYVYQQNQARLLEEVRQQEAKAYEDLLALVRSMPEDDLFDPGRFSWTRGQPFVEWIIDNSYGHTDEHLAAMKMVLGD